jgi:hypothetical protein
MKNNLKMSILMGLAIMLQVCLAAALHAQSYSAWVQDKGHPTLKARYIMAKDSKGYNFIQLEVASTVACSMQVTSSLCSSDKKDINGWRTIKILANKSVTVNFKILNSCTNGWWWWYQNYKATKAVRFDDN